MRKPTQPPPIVVSEAAGDWIAEHVLTKKYIQSCGSIKLIRKSDCQYGSCGYCVSGQHAKCAHRQPSGWSPKAGAATHIVGKRGGALAAVWTAGRACRWFCACETCLEPAAENTIPVNAPTGEIRPGYAVWLTPKTLGAPAVCWSQPKALVVSRALDAPYVVVRVDGHEHRIHVDNLRRNDPNVVREKAPKPRRAMPEGFEEAPLF